MNSEELSKRIAAMKEAKDKQLKQRAMVKKYGPFAAGGLCVLLIAGVIIIKSVSGSNPVPDVDNTATYEEIDSNVIDEDTNDEELIEAVAIEEVEVQLPVEKEPELPTSIQVGEAVFKYGYKADYVDTTIEFDDKVASEFAILINESNGEVVGKKASQEKMYPASMTKVLTVLVAYENIKPEDLDTNVIITQECTDFSYKHGCSNVGFLVDEVVTVRDLFYGTILPSGGDAAFALACFVAGSQEAFVELMNKKVEELGLEKTSHFANCVGIFDKENYTTAYDMAMIMKAAVENDFVREVLTEHTYTTSISKEHPEGITVSNWFLRRIEDKNTGGEVISAKTGFVNQSGCCAVSYFQSENGVPYICVTGNTYSSWSAIYDHVYIYSTFGK